MSMLSGKVPRMTLKNGAECTVSIGDEAVLGWHNNSIKKATPGGTVKYDGDKGLWVWHGGEVPEGYDTSDMTRFGLEHSDGQVVELSEERVREGLTLVRTEHAVCLAGTDDLLDEAVPLIQFKVEGPLLMCESWDPPNGGHPGIVTPSDWIGRRGFDPSHVFTRHVLSPGDVDVRMTGYVPPETVSFSVVTMREDASQAAGMRLVCENAVDAGIVKRAADFVIGKQPMAPPMGNWTTVKLADVRGIDILSRTQLHVMSARQPGMIGLKNVGKNSLVLKPYDKKMW